MTLRIFFIGALLIFSSEMWGQSNQDTQNNILSQFQHLIPSTTSFASWTMYEGDIDGDSKKDFIFSYILCNKYKRNIHAGSGVLIVTTDKNSKFKTIAHIPSKTKNIYSFFKFHKKVLYINEYDAKSNYKKIKRKLKFQQKKGKFIKI